MSDEHRPDHPEFVLTVFPGGLVDLSVCWDATDVPTIARALREVADGLDRLPAGYSAEGVAPLRL